MIVFTDHTDKDLSVLQTGDKLSSDFQASDVPLTECSRGRLQWAPSHLLRDRHSKEALKHLHYSNV